MLDNCTGLYMGYDYCVSIPNYRPIYTTTTAIGTAFTTSPWTHGTSSVTDLNAAKVQALQTPAISDSELVASATKRAGTVTSVTTSSVSTITS